MKKPIPSNHSQTEQPRTPIPEQYINKPYTAVLFQCQENNNTVYCAYTANHYGIKGNGTTKEFAMNNLKQNILWSIRFDMAWNDPIEYKMESITFNQQLADPFIIGMIGDLPNPEISQVDICFLSTD